MKLNSILHSTLDVLMLGSQSAFASGKPNRFFEIFIAQTLDPTAETPVVKDLRDNTEQRLVWKKQTKFVEPGKTVSPAEQRAGKRVRSTYSTGGILPTIQRVFIAPDRATARPDPKPTRLRGLPHGWSRGSTVNTLKTPTHDRRYPYPGNPR